MTGNHPSKIKQWVIYVNLLNRTGSERTEVTTLKWAVRRDVTLQAACLVKCVS